MVIEVGPASQSFRRWCDSLTHSCVLGTLRPPRLLCGAALHARWAHNTLRDLYGSSRPVDHWVGRKSEALILS